MICWLGAGAVEFVICHAEVSIVFSEEKKISEVNIFLCVMCMVLTKVIVGAFQKDIVVILYWSITRKGHLSVDELL